MRWVGAWLGLLIAVFGSTAARGEEPVGVRTIVPLGRDGITVDHAATVTWDAFQGRDHHPIDDEAFFRIVGREDLARRYHRAAVVKKSLTVGGGALVAGGLLFSFVQFWTEHGAQPATECASGCSASSRVSPAWGLAIAGTGLLSLLVGHAIDPTPIAAAEANRLATP
jgi:hypothetical protein